MGKLTKVRTGFGANPVRKDVFGGEDVCGGGESARERHVPVGQPRIVLELSPQENDGRFSVVLAWPTLRLPLVL